MSRRDHVEAMDAVWDNSFSNFSKEKKLPAVEKLDKFVGDLFCLGPYYYYVIDFSSYPEHKLSYIHKSAIEFYGIPIDRFNLEYVINRVHPDDMTVVVQCEKVVMGFISKVSNPEDLLNYKYSYTFRIKDKHDEYRLIQHQAIVISVGINATIAHAINIHTDISHITKVGSQTMSFLGLNGRKSYVGMDPYSPDYLTPVSKQLSDREREVLTMLGKGFQSKDISRILGISHHTVDTHRRNMLKKLDAANTPELIRIAKELLLF